MLGSSSSLGLFSSRSAEIIVDNPPKPFTFQGEEMLPGLGASIPLPKSEGGAAVTRKITEPHL